MPARAVRLFREAEAELKTSERWYAQRSSTAAAAFLAEVDDAFAQIAAAPETCIVYKIEDEIVYVIAVAHAKRRPEYWRRRKKP